MGIQDTTGQEVRSSSDERDYLWDAIQVWPSSPGKALLRACEARVLARFEYYGPMLDLGCGDGAFAGLLARTVELGVDLSLARCRSSSARRAHEWVVNADGASLPFASSSFGTVLSNSVLEHVRDLSGVLSGIHRTLRSGGTLAFTVPSPDKQRFLFYANWTAYSSPTVGAAYRAHFSTCWEHRHCLQPHEWVSALISVGFRDVTTDYYEPPLAAAITDLLLSIELRYLRWEGLPLSHNHVQEVWMHLLHAFLLPYYRMSVQTTGGGLVITAHK